MDGGETLATYGYLFNEGKASLLIEQLQGLVLVGCETVFVEADVSLIHDGTEFRRLLQLLERGDVVIIPSLNMFKLRQGDWQWFSQHLIRREVTLTIIQADLDKPSSLELPPKLKIDFNYAASRPKNKQQGPLGSTLGRPKISQKQIAEIINYRVNQQLTYREISALTQLSLGTVYKYIQDYQKDYE